MARKQVAGWLLLCSIMIFAMVILGGVTRLTGSGLSMVEWDPIFGFVPPLDQQQWEEAFTQYRESPEYLKINTNMDLHGFKSIYWFEFSHRVLGRSIGTVFLIPFLYFLWRGMLPRKWIPRLLFAFVLGGLQGLLGWYMVKSGLVDRPHVSQYRLTAHLGLALVIYCYLLWLMFDLLFPEREPGNSHQRSGKAAKWLLALAGTTVLSGGFVAGLKAGHAYNTFPKMGDQWLPPAGWTLQPGWRNLFENIATVQFDHRVLATLTFVTVILFWFRTRHRVTTRATRTGLNLLALVVVGQVSLGISTLLLHVPVALASLHQAGALTLLTVLLFVNHRLHKPARLF
ncbi:cytochrome c oxidase assembly protein subunit 15 [Thiogranum longum]|uniref:Cytochrome c oxidase assembly protein subunit 15 n=1 Tax=Thiogranum longum TaxID=1537524 RepID=A0A4R1HGU4_9GAMM|nr:COX15/CtaA family protein [Thiogranum longum]TCK19510.1 cytochrome c oxidase assembly protein subunit 15 [Thiogranum longum]